MTVKNKKNIKIKCLSMTTVLLEIIMSKIVPLNFICIKISLVK